ncbi:MAG: hypothetical protein ACK47B_24620 [Armatimonadota bacterium]
MLRLPHLLKHWGSRRRRGESLVELTASLTIFSIAVVAFGNHWIATERSIDMAKYRAAHARIIERRVEERRGVGAEYLLEKPMDSDPDLHYYDENGFEVEGIVAKGYYTRTSVEYLPNSTEFTDGTAGQIGADSLREITIELYSYERDTPIETTKTMVAPGGVAQDLW